MKYTESQNTTIDNSISACDKYIGTITEIDVDPDLPGITKGYAITAEYFKNNRLQLTEFNLTDTQINAYIQKGLLFKPENLKGKLVELYIRNDQFAEFDYEVAKAEIRFYNNTIPQLINKN